MYPSPLWLLLNRPQSSGTNGSEDAPQDQTPAGASITQSLIDLWNRAARGYGPAGGGLACPAPPFSQLSGQSQSDDSPPPAATQFPPFPYVPPDTTPPTVWSAPTPPNPWALPGSPVPADPAAALPDQSPDSPDVEMPGAASSTPETSEPISPEARDAALLALGLRVKAEPLPKRRYVPGDFSGGLHGALIQAQMDAARKQGCRVEPEIGFGAPYTTSGARADWVQQCPPRVPDVHEGKTNQTGELTDNQDLIYPAIANGTAFSTSPRIKTFGYLPYQTLPPWTVWRHWQKYPSTDIDLQKIFDSTPTF